MNTELYPSNSLYICGFEDGQFLKPRLTPTLPSFLRELRPHVQPSAHPVTLRLDSPSEVTRADEGRSSAGPEHPLLLILLLPQTLFPRLGGTLTSVTWLPV